MLWFVACAAPLPDADTVAAEALSRFDADRDGVVTQAEYAPFADDFADLDGDRDGALTPAELRAWLESKPDASPANRAPPPPPPSNLHPAFPTGPATPPGR
jgi:Ca2+-binding EF-hand superfamily protein